jgi:hypothetical protein
VVTRTGITAKEFSQEFADEAELFTAAFGYGQALIAQTLIAAIQDRKRWLSRVRTAVLSILRFLDQEPGWAELLLISPPPAGAEITERRERIIARLAQLLERGAPKSSEQGPTLKSGLAAELVIGGAFSVIEARMLRHKGMPLLELAPSLMSLIVLPYLGAEQANAELARRPRAIAAQRSGKLSHSRRRASYRTVLVLRAIAQAPRSHNRAIAQAAGLSDEGQTSKLLSRLRRQGLIENVGLGQAYGEPNAWLLTSEGRQVLAAEGQSAAQTLKHDASQSARKARASQEGQPACEPADIASPGAAAQASQSGTRRRGRATCQS